MKKIAKIRKKENWAGLQPSPRRSLSPQRGAASLRRSRIAKMATHRFASTKQCFAAAKPLFTRAKIFIFFPKVLYSCTDSLRTLIND